MNNWKICHDYHCGGYAKVNSALNEFVSTFNARHNFVIEPIYSGKMFYAVFNMIRNGTIPAGATALAIHTGGLQGMRGMQQQNPTALACTQ